MIYRTRHIFLLLTGLIAVSIGAYVTPQRAWRRAAQWMGFALLGIGAGLFLMGFIVEPSLSGLWAPYSHNGASCDPEW